MATWFGATLLSLVCLFLRCVNGATSDRECYWPSGVAASVTQGDGDPYFACYPENDESHCCLEGEACLSNGLCFGARLGVTYRGGCTDKGWTSSACPQYCTDAYRWANLYACGNGNWFCGNGTFCESGADGTLFDYPEGLVYSIANDTTEASTSTQSSNSTSTSTSNTIDQTSTATVTVSSKPSSGKVDKAVPIGVGVGIGIPLAIAAVVFGAMWYRTRKELKALKAAPPQMQYVSAPYQPVPFEAADDTRLSELPDTARLEKP